MMGFAPTRNGRRVASFIIGLVVVLGFLEILARFAEDGGAAALRWYDASTQLRAEEMDRRDDIDVVFAGTSMAWQGLVPSVWTANDVAGRSAFNVGMAGGVPQVMEPWLLDVVQPELKPELVVWGLSSLDLSSSYGADNLKRYEDALEIRQGAVAALERHTAKYSALVRYRSVLRDPGEWGEDRGFTAAAASLGADGERRDFVIDTSARRRRQVEARLKAYSLDPADIAAIHRTVVRLREAGTEVVFVQMPVPERFAVLHPEGAADLATTRRAITHLGEVLDVDVIDATAGFTDLDFVDFTHLNESAAAALTSRVAREVSGAQSVPVEATISDAELLAIANDLVAMADLTRSALTRSGSKPASSDIWRSSTEYGHTRDLWAYHEEGVNFHTIFVGSSMVYAGLDPAIYTEATGLTAYNVGLPGAGPEGYRAYFNDVVMPTMDPQRVIIGVAPRDARSAGHQEGSCIDPTAGNNKSRAIRDDLFSAVNWFADVSPENLLLGDPVRHDPPRATPMHARYRSGFSMLGDRKSYAKLSAKRLQREAVRVQSRVSLYEFCDERVGVLSSWVTDLTSRGLEVFVLAMPISTIRADALPGGYAELEQTVADFETAVIAAGASRFLDFKDLLPDDQFTDHVHANRAGSHALTQALADAVTAE